MISIAITSYKEPETIGKAIESFTSQKLPDYDLIVSAPDEETLAVARKYARKNKRIVIIKDEGRGKPAALNLISKRVKGDIIIFSDGDVQVSNKSVYFLLNALKDEKVGAVTGRPVSSNSTRDKFGFWAYILTEIANERRIKAQKLNKGFFCSGYLFAIRKRLLPKLPEELLSEDGYISHHIYEMGFKIAYSPDSIVYVKYPTNFSDWIIQKKRSAGGYSQIRKIRGIEIRSFRSESSGGLAFFKFPKNLKQFLWLINLFIARIYLWAAIYIDINIRKKSQKEIWRRVESTK